jgi:hypothetical protein
VENSEKEQLLKMLVKIYRKLDIVERKIDNKPSRHFENNETYYTELLKESGLNNL